MKILQNEKTRDAKNRISNSASEKTGQYPGTRHNLQPHHKYYNSPVKFYNPTRKTGYSSDGSFIDSIYSPPQPPIATSKDATSSPGMAETTTLNTHQPQVEKSRRSKGEVDTYYQKKIDFGAQKSMSGDTKAANVPPPPKQFRTSDIQDEVAKPDGNTQVEVVTNARPATSVVAEDRKGKRVVELILY